MRIGIDLHGVIDSDPDFFKKLLKYLISSGIEVHIVSGPPVVEIISELEELKIEEKIHYHKVHSIVDFLKKSGVVMWNDEKGRWWSNEKDWCNSKSWICWKYGIDCMVDDKVMYKAGFDSFGISFILFNGVRERIKLLLSTE